MELRGHPTSIELAKLAIMIMLQQRQEGNVVVDFQELEARDDVSTFMVPKETVGFVLGSRGATLRQMESRHGVFMFFNNNRVYKDEGGDYKRLYLIGRRNAREV